MSATTVSTTSRQIASAITSGLSLMTVSSTLCVRTVKAVIDGLKTLALESIQLVFVKKFAELKIMLNGDFVLAFVVLILGHFTGVYVCKPR